MRFPRQTLPLALLTLATACGQGGNSSARPITMLDPTAHDSFFPIAAGSKHALGSDSPAITCDSCHGGADSFKQFDCLSCHQHQDPAMLTAGHRGVSQFAYDSASCYSCHPSGTAGGAVPPGAISDPARSVTVNAQIPSYVDTSISSLSPQTETLPMPMYHASPNVVAAALASCGNCHVNAGMGAYYPGDLHLSLANLNLVQPSACGDCHATSMPTGFVGPTATNPARTPASSEMKHDAVLWSNGLPTKKSAVPPDCAVCHVTPTMSMLASWATNTPGARAIVPGAGTTPALFHASLTSATPALAQPASCIDCHANTRPDTLLCNQLSAACPPGSVDAPGLPVNLQFDHSAEAAECATCHMSGSAAQNWAKWTHGLFHHAGDPNPTSCLPCHGGDRPTTTVNAPSGWINPPSSTKPFDTVTNSIGIGHGDDRECATCHNGPGTGAWGGSQNWATGLFTHGLSPDSGTTCIACHSTQRPAFQLTPTNSALPSTAAPLCAGVATACFDHSTSGTGDCIGCHQATVSYTNYGYSGPSPHFSGGNWAGGIGYPADTLAASQSQYITLTEITLNPSPPSLVTSTSSITTKLNNAMLHHRAQWTCANDGTRACAVDADCATVGGQCLATVLDAGDAQNEDTSKCAVCHAVSGPGAIKGPGQFHSVLTTLGFQQPAINCFDCHAQMRPTGIVEKTTTSDLQPMDHNAVFNSPVTIKGVSVGGVAAMDCSNCHASPGNTWSDGFFHKNIAAAGPKDCTVCHYPLMVDAAKADLTSGTNYAMRHKSGQITFQNCQTCHTGALAKGQNTPIAATLWLTGAFHASLASQPTACLTCHAISEPAANASTQSSVNYNLNMGGTSTNAAQWMNHGSGSVTGKDCFTCHAADANTSVTAGSPWSKSDSFHAAVSSPSSCKECHGLTNGGGSTAGTNNNLPVGLTNSSTVTSAAADSTTDVPAGTLDQITHADINVSGHDCNFCHTQKGVSTVSGVQGKEWAQAAFHANFTSANPLVIDGNTGRCSDCHMNVKPTARFTLFDHSAFSVTPGTQDCSYCHSWPGTGTPTSPNWLGASAAPATVTLTNWGYGSPTTNTVTFAHPSSSTYTSCAQCHAGSTFSTIIDYNHDGLTRNVTINGVAATPNLGTSQYNVSTNPTFCVACHSSNSQWVSRGVSSTITANTLINSTTVTTPSTSALTLGMTISGTGIPNTTTTTTTITGATITSGSTTVTTASPVSLRAGTVISGTGIPANDTVATSVTNATSFTLTTAATASATGVTLTATQTNPLTVTIKAIPSATSFTVSTAANATTTGTTLTVTHMSIMQFRIGSHESSTNGEDCTSCHYVGSRTARLTPPTPGVFATGSISGN